MYFVHNMNTTTVIYVLLDIAQYPRYIAIVGS